jgi:hypothetical protein
MGKEVIFLIFFEVHKKANIKKIAIDKWSQKIHEKVFCPNSIKNPP